RQRPCPAAVPVDVADFAPPAYSNYRCRHHPTFERSHCGDYKGPSPSAWPTAHALRSFPLRSENSKSQRNDATDKILDQPGEMCKSGRGLAGAQIVIAVGVVLGICYFAKLVLVTIVFLLLISACLGLAPWV